MKGEEQGHSDFFSALASWGLAIWDGALSAEHGRASLPVTTCEQRDGVAAVGMAMSTMDAGFVLVSVPSLNFKEGFVLRAVPSYSK